MANLQSLAKDTAVYGLSSIIGRFLNYLLVPLYTASLAASSGGYGVITEVYSYTALLLVLLTFGMETTFFRYISKGEDNPDRVYSTTLISVGFVGICFITLLFLFLPQIAGAAGFTNHPEYIGMMAVVVALDAFQAIPFAYLRYKREALKFAALKLLFIILNIALNLLFFVVMGKKDVFYAFAANLACTGLITFFFIPELRGFRWTLDRPLLKRMLRYTWPMLLLGLIGILNQTADKLILPQVLEGQEGRVQLGIYGACVKIAMIMAMITQAFRYAYEPFVFAGSKDKNSKETYAKAMKFYLIFALFAFLTVMAYMDILQYIIAEDYRQGLAVVPIVMVAEIMMGVYFNLSLWYKLSDRTVWGAICSALGCIILIAGNVLFIPQYGYMACAWSGVAGYTVATLVSYFAGRHYFPVPYPLWNMAGYILLTAFFFAVMTLVPSTWPIWLRLGINTGCLLLFAAHVVYHDLPLSQLPVIGQHFRRK